MKKMIILFSVGAIILVFLGIDKEAIKKAKADAKINSSTTSMMEEKLIKKMEFKRIKRYGAELWSWTGKVVGKKGGLPVIDIDGDGHEDFSAIPPARINAELGAMVVGQEYDQHTIIRVIN